MNCNTSTNFKSSLSSSQSCNIILFCFNSCRNICTDPGRKTYMRHVRSQIAVYQEKQFLSLIIIIMSSTSIEIQIYISNYHQELLKYGYGSISTVFMSPLFAVIVDSFWVHSRRKGKKRKERKPIRIEQEPLVIGDA